MFCDRDSRLVTLLELGEGPLIHLINTNGFHVKTENERFTDADSCHDRHNLKYKYSASSFGRPCQ